MDTSASHVVTVDFGSFNEFLLLSASSLNESLLLENMKYKRIFAIVL